MQLGGERGEKDRDGETERGTERGREKHDDSLLPEERTFNLE
jgi:hypothetical protein